jgi:hypothetical protein
MEKCWKTQTVSKGKPEGKTLLGRTRSRWETNVKMDVGELGRKRVD